MGDIQGRHFKGNVKRIYTDNGKEFTNISCLSKRVNVTFNIYLVYLVLVYTHYYIRAISVRLKTTSAYSVEN